MSTKHSAAPECEEQLSAVLVACLEALDAGRPLDRDDLLARYPQFAGELARFLDDQADVERCAAPLRAVANGTSPRPDSPWPQLGDFRIVREVGRGGMGIVYEAEQVPLKRRVALKVLPFAATLDPKQLQRFRLEAQAAAGLHHSNIVPVYGVGSERGVHYYAMQFIDGLPLDRLLDQLRRSTGRPAGPTGEATVAAPPPKGGEAPAAGVQPPLAAAMSTVRSGRGREYYRTVARWGVQAAEALDYAHQVGVVHRDVKPGNLLVEERGQLWVTDFGLARIQSEASLTATGDLVGTLRYMSPEQALAKRVPIDHRTDVYSLGATLYELLTLRPPFPGTDRQELLRQIAFDDPCSPRRLERAVPEELETIVLKALEKGPQDRYGTAQELADDLRRWLEDRPIRARRPAPMQRLRRWGRRHRAAMVAAVVCLLVTLAAGVGSAAWILGERAARQQEARTKVLSALGEARPRLQRGNPEDPALMLVVQRAEDQQGTGMLSPELQGRVQQLRRDLHMLEQLDQARLQSAVGKSEMGWDFAGADQLYAQAFAEYGLEVTSLGSSEVAQRVRASVIGPHLASGLDDWAAARDKLGRGRGAALRALADLADDDPWRRRLREALEHDDRDALEALAEEAAARSQPPTQLALLARALEGAGSWSAAERLLRRVQPEHPEDFWVNLELALTLSLKKSPDWVEAGRFYQAALAQRPLSPGVLTNLGVALLKQGKTTEAVAAFQKAIELKPDFPRAYLNLGAAFAHQQKWMEAVEASRKATELEPNRLEAHMNLGMALQEQQKLPEAVAAFHKAITLRPAFAEAHYKLGNALFRNGQLDDAIAEWQEAVRLKKDFADAHYNLGQALSSKGQLDDAIAEWQEAVRLKKDFAGAHYNLGLALFHKGQLDEAIAQYREVLRYKKNWAEAYCNLGQALLIQGQFTEALTALKRGHDLGSRKPGWPYPSATWIQRAEHLVELDARVPQLLKGDSQPADAQECLDLGFLCARKRLPAAAARWYGEGFAARPAVADDLSSKYRYNAACAAVLAGCGQGKDADHLDDKERARWRRQGLAWLRADLEARRGLLEKVSIKAGPAVELMLQHCLEDPDFAGVRGEQALAKLPEAERGDWQKLWADVAALLAQVQARRAPQKKPGEK